VGEASQLDLGAVSAGSWAGLAWLIVAGSFVGFSCYLWLLRNVRTSLVSTYAYVNPIVAVTLGVVVLDEALTGRLFVSGAIVLASVAMIVSAGGLVREEAGDVGAGEPAIPDSELGQHRGAQVEREV
jgi:drug/metabolite transporter (DMT)-like permease